jgi:hypothetical protein
MKRRRKEERERKKENVTKFGGSFIMPTDLQ